MLNSNLSDAAYQIIKERIISQEYPPGQRLNIKEISIQLGISITPLKKAVDQLALEDLIVILPRSGTFVTDLSLEEISEAFDLRIAVEVYCIGQVAEKITSAEINKLAGILEELKETELNLESSGMYQQYLLLDHRFHRTIIGLLQNERIMRTFQHVNVHSQMARIRYKKPEDNINQVQFEHQRILESLSDHDPKRAQNEMDSHLNRAKISLLNDVISNRSKGEKVGKVSSKNQKNKGKIEKRKV
jgi:DNA-binding GntR family transcriptional regulator